MGEICPNCGNVIQEVDQKNFCGSCGSKLRQLNQQQSSSASAKQPPSSLSNGEKEAVYFKMLEEAWADSKLTIEEVRELNNLRLQLGISETRASELGQKAIESLRPVQQSELEEKPDGSSCGIALLINTNQFYMRNNIGVLDVIIKNLGDVSIDSVEMEVSGDLLAKTEHFSCLLKPFGEKGGEINKMFSNKLSDSGINLVRFKIVVRQGEEIHAFWAEKDFPVFQETTDLNQISIQAETFIDSSIGDGSKVMATDINNQLDSLKNIGKIKNTNDFIDEYRKLPPDYKVQQLIFDPESSKYLNGPEPDSHRGVVGFDSRRAWGIPVSPRASRFSSEWAAFDSGAKIQVPLEGADSTLYALNNSGKLMAIEASTGRKRWQAKIGESEATSSFAVLVMMDFVFVAVADGTILCFDKESGKHIGQCHVPGLCGQLGALHAALYVGTSDHRLLKLDIPSLKVLAEWSLEDKLIGKVLGGQCGSCSCIFAPCENSFRAMVTPQERFTKILETTLTGQPSADHGIICVPSQTVSEDKHLRGLLRFLRPTTQTIPCKYQTEAEFQLDAPVIGGPVFIGSSVSVACSNGDVILFEITLDEKPLGLKCRWRTNVGFQPARGMASSGQRLFVCGSDHRSGVLCCLDAGHKGKLIDQVNFKARVRTAPLVINHVVHVATNDGRVNAYRMAEEYQPIEN